MKTGIELITEERQRQIKKEGYDNNHDNEHIFGELSVAAACYAVNKLPEPMRKDLGDLDKVEVLRSWHRGGPNGDAFPWQKECDKREKHNRLKSLVIAGALIAAEIDRLNQVEDNCEILGTCENCRVLFFDSDEYEIDNEGIYLCKPCMKELITENKNLNHNT